MFIMNDHQAKKISNMLCNNDQQAIENNPQANKNNQQANKNNHQAIQNK